MHKDVVHIHTMEYYSVIRRNEIVPFTEMKVDPETVIKSRINK